jgi:hypothetical protein
VANGCEIHPSQLRGQLRDFTGFPILRKCGTQHEDVAIQ